MRFRTLLSLALLVPLVVTGALVISVMYVNADRHSTDMARKLMASVTAQAAHEVYAHSEHAVGLARSLERLGPGGLSLGDSDKLALQLVELLRDNPNITWISFSNPAGGFTGAYRNSARQTCINQSTIIDGKTRLTEHIVDPAGNRSFLRSDPDSGYDPRTRPFYQRAVERRELVWLPPYIFYEQSIPGISCAVPVYGVQDSLMGVFSVDYDLNYLSELAARLRASPHSQVMVFNEDYLLLAHSAVRVVQQPGHRDYGKLITPADVADSTTQALVGQLRHIDLRTLPDEPRWLSFPDASRDLIACVMPMPLESGPLMYIATVAPKSDFAPSAWHSSRHALLLALGAFMATGILALLVTRAVSGAVTTLVRATERIGAGDLEVSVSLGPLREFRKLSAAFHTMLANLRDSVRVRQSLLLTREVQRRLVPAAPPRINGLDISGFVAYCDETGGDYYDFIEIPATQDAPAGSARFLVALGDMMGHGLPAALMMAGARGALRSALATCHRPAVLLTRMNDVFYHDTEGRRFMTMCLVAFDHQRGELLWSSAGHDPPIIYDPVAGGFHEPQGGDVPLGVLEHVDYVDYRFDAVNVGQIYFIGSDGVWETENSQGEQFGKGRLKAVLATCAHRSAEDIKGCILEALEDFRNGFAVRDDVTFIIIKVLSVPTDLPVDLHRPVQETEYEEILAPRR